MKTILLLISVSLLSITQNDIKEIKYGNKIISVQHIGSIYVKNISFPTYTTNESELCIITTNSFTGEYYPVFLGTILPNEFYNGNQLRITKKGFKFYLDLDSYNKPFAHYLDP